MSPTLILILMLTVALVLGQGEGRGMQIIVIKWGNFLPFIDTEDCPDDLELSPWSDAEPCEPECGEGSRYQKFTREVLTQSSSTERWWEREGCRLEKWEECIEPCPGNVGVDIQGLTQNGICLALMFTGGRGQGYFNGWNIIPNEGTFKYDMIIFQLLEKGVWIMNRIIDFWLVFVINECSTG